MVNNYTTRTIDQLLDEYLPYLPAIAIEGPKGVGKTETALQRATTTLRMDAPAVVEMVQADSSLVANPTGTLLIDEWQLYPSVWDLVRRAVDDGAAPGTYLLTGSAYPAADARIHSGAARIDRIRMRPFALHERVRNEGPSISMSDLFEGIEPDIGAGELDDANLQGVAGEICQSGFPTIMDLPPKIRDARLDAYLDRIVTHEFAEQGLKVRNPQAVMRWLRAYASATSRMDSYTEILDKATPGEGDKPARKTADTYRNLLEQLMILEPLPAWSPFDTKMPPLVSSPKHNLCDPALAARLLGANEKSLTSGDTKQSALFGQLFESLVVLSCRVIAETLGATVSHLRTRQGGREVDIIIESRDKRVVGVEVKTSAVVGSEEVKHLVWLRNQLGERFAAGIVVHAGSQFYRSPDGIWVIPLRVLGRV